MSGTTSAEPSASDVVMDDEEVQGASEANLGVAKSLDLGAAMGDQSSASAPTPSTTVPQPDNHLPTPQPSLNPLPSSPASAPISADSLHSRRSSQFQPTRPAPPSPAPSRRTSQIHSPALSSRDRASSTSSSSAAISTGGSGSGSGAGVSRKLSQSQGLGHRNSLAGKARPRSSLGTAMYIGQSEDIGLGLGGHEEDKEKSHVVSGEGSGSALDIPGSTSTSTTTADHSGFTTQTPSPSRSTALTPTSPSATNTPSRQPSIPSLVIRDYAFPASDDRYHGLHPILPADQSSSSSRLSSYLSSTLASDRRLSVSAEKKDKEKGWGFSLLGWRGFMGGRKSRSNSRSSDNNPHSGGMADDHSEPDLPNAPEGLGVGDEDDDDDDDYAFESSSEDDEEPFGLYRAAYAFDPEGEHEIGLEEGEIVEVKGRGGGEGWVVAIKLKGGVVAGEAVEGLVPEGYLEKVSEEEMKFGQRGRTVAPDGISEEPEETSDLESGPGR